MNNTTSTLDASTPQHEANFTWLTLIPVLIFCFMMMIPMLPAPATAAELREAANSEDKTANPLTKMSLEQRKKAYKRAFLSNGNYITLTNNNLFESENKEIKMNSPSCELVDIELGDDEIASSKSMHLVFENQYTEANQRRTNVSSCKNKQKQQQQQQQQQIVTTHDSSCIICFDDFNVNDTIVWSENYECPHFYHRECMIDYFASKQQKRKLITGTNLRENHNLREDQSNGQSDDNADDISRTERTINYEPNTNNTIIEDNPCPTCRRNFCSVTLNDLMWITATKSSSIEEC
jgi:hypothetical protein